MVRRVRSSARTHSDPHVCTRARIFTLALARARVFKVKPPWTREVQGEEAVDLVVREEEKRTAGARESRVINRTISHGTWARLVFSEIRSIRFRFIKTCHRDICFVAQIRLSVTRGTQNLYLSAIFESACCIQAEWKRRYQRNGRITS